MKWCSVEARGRANQTGGKYRWRGSCHTKWSTICERTSSSSHLFHPFSVANWVEQRVWTSSGSKWNTSGEVVSYTHLRCRAGCHVDDRFQPKKVRNKQMHSGIRCSPSVTLHCLGTDENDGCVDGRLFVFNCQAKGIKWKTSVRSRWICLTWASGTVPTQRHREGARYESVSLYEQDVKMYQV